MKNVSFIYQDNEILKKQIKILRDENDSYKHTLHRVRGGLLTLYSGEDYYKKNDGVLRSNLKVMEDLIAKTLGE